MKSLFIKNRYFLITVLLFIISELIVDPRGEFPLNDDWSYTHSVLLLHNEGRIDIGEWAAMSLLTHLWWGNIFITIFGFSFFILRCSTLISALIGIFFLNRLVTSITGKSELGFIAGLTLLFNPLYFNLSNTFLTDVGFTTLIILCCYFVIDFFRTRQIFPLLMVFVLSVLLVLLRQFGILLPLCFTFACLFLDKKKWFFLSLAVIFSLGVLFVFKYYEHYLKQTIPASAAYIYSGSISLKDPILRDRIVMNVLTRLDTTFMLIFIYSFPFTIMFMPALAKMLNKKTVAGLMLLSVVCSLFFFANATFPGGNILSNMSLGPDTFYESDIDSLHTYSKGFRKFSGILKFIYCWVSLITLFLFLKAKIKSTFTFKDLNPAVIFLLCVFFSYMFTLYAANSFFDRYHLPLLSVYLVIAAYVTNTIAYKPILFVVFIPVFFYISVFGTRDYLTMNKKKWEAYNFVRFQKNIPNKKINAGFEASGWNDGITAWWPGHLKTEGKDYLIQYRKEAGFTLMKSYPFQRFFPYKMDTLNLFKRVEPVD